MDKETLSNYGWIVICVLVMVVMIALATPFGSFISEAVQSTTQGLFDVNQNALDAAGIQIMEQEFEDMLNSESTTVDGIGDVSVSDNTMDYTYDENTGLISGVKPADGNETAPELPASAIPNTIDFTFGTFESNVASNTVEYETTVVEAKKPVGYGKVNYTYWVYNQDGSIKAPAEATVNTFKIKLSDYVVYNANTGENKTMEGQTADVLVIYTMNNQGTLDNAVYLAAYLNKTEGTKNNHIAKWNGTTYDEVNYDAQINAVTEFTQTRVVKETKTVTTQTTPSGYTYVPSGTFKAEAGMTWAEWLTSDYNTTGITSGTIKDVDYNNISADATITAGSYGFAVAASEPQPTLLKFGIDVYNAEFEYEEGMTWGEWYESDYCDKTMFKLMGEIDPYIAVAEGGDISQPDIFWGDVEFWDMNCQFGDEDITYYTDVDALILPVTYIY